MRDVSRDAIDHQPPPALPTPTRRRGCFLGQNVIHPNHASHHEQLLGHIVRSAHGKFFQSTIHIHGPNLQLLRSALIQTSGRLDRRPLTESNDVWLGASRSRRHDKKQTRRDAKKKAHAASLSSGWLLTQGQIAHFVSTLPKMTCPRVGRVFAETTGTSRWATAKSVTIVKAFARSYR